MCGHGADNPSRHLTPGIFWRLWTSAPRKQQRPCLHMFCSSPALRVRSPSHRLSELLLPFQCLLASQALNTAGRHCSRGHGTDPAPLNHRHCRGPAFFSHQHSRAYHRVTPAWQIAVPLTCPGRRCLGSNLLRSCWKRRRGSWRPCRQASVMRTWRAGACLFAFSMKSLHSSQG